MWKYVIKEYKLIYIYIHILDYIHILEKLFISSDIDENVLFAHPYYEWHVR